MRLTKNTNKRSILSRTYAVTSSKLIRSRRRCCLTRIKSLCRSSRAWLRSSSRSSKSSASICNKSKRKIRKCLTRWSSRNPSWRRRTSWALSVDATRLNSCGKLNRSCLSWLKPRWRRTLQRMQTSSSCKTTCKSNTESMRNLSSRSKCSSVKRMRLYTPINNMSKKLLCLKHGFRPTPSGSRQSKTWLASTSN